MTRIANGVAHGAERLAKVMVAETGKTIRDCRAEVMRCVDTFRIAAREAVGTAARGEWVDLGIAARTTGYQGIIRRFPVGVCSFITPFNFPLNLVAHKAGPAIAAGCPWVLKPADKAPLCALMLGEIMAEAGLPEGSWSIIPARVEDSAALIEDDRVAMISFTGSARVGYGIKARAGRKRVLLELGGNAACIVDEGADLDRAADRITMGAFGSNGQSCISVQRVFVHQSAGDGLTQRLAMRAKTLVCGDPKEERTDVGPVITEADAVRMISWVEEAVDHGAKLLCGGKRDGSLVEPTWLLGVRDIDRVCCEEVFGPVGVINTYEDFEEVLGRVNAGAYGLQAGVFTTNLGRAMLAFERLEVGGVVVDDVPTFRSDALPYGGVKMSGLGREGVKSAIEEMTELRTLVLRTAK